MATSLAALGLLLTRYRRAMPASRVVSGSLGMAALFAGASLGRRQGENAMVSPENMKSEKENR